MAVLVNFISQQCVFYTVCLVKLGQNINTSAETSTYLPDVDKSNFFVFLKLKILKGSLYFLLTEHHHIGGVKVQPHALAAQPPRERASGTPWIGGWMGPRASLNAVVKRKIPSPCHDSNPDHPTHSTVLYNLTYLNHCC
jgi:hypothetical protein